MGRRRYPVSPAHPRHWPAWAGLGCAWLLAQLPWPALEAIGAAAGRASWLLARERRRIAATNIALCFPELGPEAREELARRSVEGAGRALVEAAASYFKTSLDLSGRLEVAGLEHLQAAHGQGRGVLLLGMHFATLDIAVHLLERTIGPKFNVVYRPNDNPVLDRVILRGRGRHLNESIDRGNLRRLVRTLRSGEIVWYAPDQDYGTRHSVFAPFLGVPAATVTATARIARLSGCQVVPVAHVRLPGGRYRLEFGPALTGFPVEDEVMNATRVNEVIGSYVRRYPDQYLWVHRRFKHRPPGSPSPYRNR